MTSHRRDLVSLFFGLVFTLCGVAFLDRSEDWDLFDTQGLLAFGLIAIGVLGVLLVLTGARRGTAAMEPATTDAGPTTDDAGEDLPDFDDPYGPLDQFEPDAPADPT